MARNESDKPVLDLSSLFKIRNKHNFSITKIDTASSGICYKSYRNLFQFHALVPDLRDAQLQISFTMRFRFFAWITWFLGSSSCRERILYAIHRIFAWICDFDDPEKHSIQSSHCWLHHANEVGLHEIVEVAEEEILDSDLQNFHILSHFLCS